jgi:hypothetical protein
MCDVHDDGRPRVYSPGDDYANHSLGFALRTGCSRPLTAGAAPDSRRRFPPAHSSRRYPTFHTVTMRRGAAGVGSSLRRNSATWMSTVRLDTSDRYPDTARRSSSRVATAPPVEQRGEQVVLLGGERHGGAGAAHHARRSVHLDRPDPRQQFRRAERFGHVVVGAEAEAAHLVLLGAAGGEQEDRRVGRERRGGPVAERAQHAEPVESGEHHVEDDQVGAPNGRGADAVGPGAGRRDLLAVGPQGTRDREREVGVVLDHEHARHAGTSRSAARVPGSATTPPGP